MSSNTSIKKEALEEAKKEVMKMYIINYIEHIVTNIDYTENDRTLMALKNLGFNPDKIKKEILGEE